MQPSGQITIAQAAQEAEEAEALAVLGPAVLMNGLIFAELWAKLGESQQEAAAARLSCCACDGRLCRD
ncbi:hypothetical protein FOA52_002996 [Chlamydomonas sp. UWO 241]|nr:hypothetical protein FOA52_002996 [Chlamydomonas sp. UWO 241]